MESCEIQGVKGTPSSEKSSPPKLRTRELPENLADPFDGQSVGVLVPGEFEETEDDLWTHVPPRMTRTLPGEIPGPSITEAGS